VATAALAYELAGRRGQFATALHSAPVSILALVVALQVFALISRTEAWYVCVRATGATVPRRTLFRAAGIGYLASIINGSLGVAARITSLRRAAPDTCPKVPALLAAEVPIISVEVALAAIFSFTLVAPLGVPWWVPIVAVALTGAATFGLTRLSHHRTLGLWSGLAVMHRGRGRMTVLVLLAVCAQIARNWLVLRALGVHISVLDAIALLIGMFTLGQLPFGPSLGTATAVLILGSHGIALAAAAGVLLTVTAIAGSFFYAGWAIGDHLLLGRIAVNPEAAVAPSSA